MIYMFGGIAAALTISWDNLTILGIATLSMYAIGIAMRGGISSVLDIPYVFSYILLIPTYVNILYIYAIANLHDVTWGNRPTELSEGDKNK